MHKRIFLLFCSLLFSSHLLVATSLYPLTLKEITEHSTTIIEGTVVQKTAFYNPTKTFIYTRITVSVTATFLGETKSKIDIIADGGMLDNTLITTSAEQNIAVGDMGIFFLSIKQPKTVQLSTSQSYFKYNEVDNSLSNPFFNYSLSSNQFWDLLSEIIKKPIRKNTNKIAEVNNQANPLITAITPTNISAGTESILTITGSGFGTENTGMVLFANPDDGGATYISAIASTIISWTNNRITLKVPFRAGTGKVWVKQNGNTAISSQTLTVNYARANAESGVYNYKVELSNLSKFGGYLIKENSSFSENKNASESYKYALGNWRCNSLINFTLTENTTISTNKKDNTNIVRFAEKNELKLGVLGITYSYYESCGDGIWYLKEFDMCFIDSDFWNFDTTLTSNNKYDFKTVALHELGHAHQLAHVIDPKNIMHYSVNMGVNKREIDTQSLLCANEILSSSKNTSECGYTRMKLLDANICNDVHFTYYEFLKPTVYPNPSNKLIAFDFFLPEITSGSIEIFNSSGQLISTPFSATFVQGNNSFTMNLQEYNFTNGLYFFKLNALNKSFVNKVMIVQ